MTYLKSIKNCLYGISAFCIICFVLFRLCSVLFTQLRLELYGENKLQEQKKKSNIILFLGQFNDFMIILLIVASIFSAIISYVRNESFVDSIIIIVI